MHRKTLIFTGVAIPPRVFTRVENFADLYVINICEVAYLVKSTDLDKLKVKDSNVILPAYNTEKFRWTYIKYKIGSIAEIRDEDF